MVSMIFYVDFFQWELLRICVKIQENIMLEVPHQLRQNLYHPV